MVRNLRVKDRPFAMIGDKAQPLDQLTVILKLPVSFEMVQGLWFVRESRGWYRRHDWVISHFGPHDAILGEMDTLKGWMRQSYRAVAGRKLAALVGEG